MNNYYTPIKPEPPTCPYNDGVTCNPDERNCACCGFDPAVAKARLARICKKLGIPAPETQEPEAQAETE